MNAIPKKLQLLVDKKLEGTLSDDERETLQQWLSASEEANAYASQMEDLHRSLVDAGKEKKFVDFSDAVMEQISTNQIRNNPSKVINLASRLRHYNTQAMKYAAMLVVGLLLGSAVTVMLFLGKTGLQEKDVSATISARSGQAITFDEEAWQIHIQPLVATDMVILIVSVTSSQMLTMNLSFDQQVYRLESTRFLGSKGSSGVSSRSGTAGVEITGDQVFQMVFQRHPGMMAPMIMELLQDDISIYQREIMIP